MTGPRTPATEAGRRYLNILAPVSTTPDGIRDREETAADIIAIEAEARASVIRPYRAAFERGRADERERLAGAVRVADAALAFDDAQRAYLGHLDRPDKPENPDLDDPAVAAEWFGPWNRATEANRVFRLALYEYRAILAGEVGRE